MDFVCDRFQSEHGIDLRQSLTARSRLLAAVEEAKKRLSYEPVVTVEEEFIAEKDGLPLNLRVDVSRDEYEELIEPLVGKTLKCLDDALADARLQAPQIAKVLLVGGATRTPLVHKMLHSRLGRPVHAEIEPDLAVALGAAVQGGLIAGVDVGPVLVDITPRTLGIETLGYDAEGFDSKYCFSPIIERNTPLPAVRTEIYFTAYDDQTEARIRVFQGEDADTRHNEQVGELFIQGLAKVPSPNEILVRLELDLNGILRVTATERATGLARQAVIDNMMERFRLRERVDALERLDRMFESAPARGDEDDEDTLFLDVAAVPVEVKDPGVDSDPELGEAIGKAESLIAKSGRVEQGANVEDVDELKGLVADLRAAISRRSLGDINRIAAEVEDLVFYLQG